MKRALTALGTAAGLMNSPSTPLRSETDTLSGSVQRAWSRNRARRVALRNPVERGPRPVFPPSTTTWCQLEELRPWHPVGLVR